ncbi:MAG: 4-hydroxy-3-methylbut-2-enyl diphosphate reductase [Termitinemataceae bacterium]
MKIIRAEHCGYCMGVERAIKQTYEKINQNKGKLIFTLGPLIHNKVALEDLANQGVSMISDPKDLKAPQNSLVIIRAHGIPPSVEDQFTAQGVELFDATCPKVKAIHRKVRNYESEGFQVLITGDKNHSEVVGILGYAPKSIVIESMDDARQLVQQVQSLKASEQKVVLVSQTTFNEVLFEQISSFLQQSIPNLHIDNTICRATRDRQEAIQNLCDKVNAILVIGGKNSANTQRLKQIVEERGKPVWLIETADDIPPEVFSFETIGLSAGASTPPFLIDQIERILTSP